jgi:hypothetical protein
MVRESLITWNICFSCMILRYSLPYSNIPAALRPIVIKLP